MPHTGESLQNLFKSLHGDLGRILQVVNQLQLLNKLVQGYLPENLRSHVHVLNITQGKLILEVDNSSWASKSRFALPELLSNLRKTPELAHLKHIDQQIAVKNHKDPQSSKAEPSGFKLSEQTTQDLIHTIEKTADKELKKTLTRFLRHYGTGTNILKD